MKPRSSTLFHFTKSEGILFDIFKNGFWPRYCLENLPWKEIKKNQFIAFPMVCFCDIPLARISEHVGFYGSYGIGLSKSWAEKNCLNPLFYHSSESKLSDIVGEIMGSVLKLAGEDRVKAIDDIKYLIAYSKPTIGRMIIDGKPISKEFYQESEWRYVPKNENVETHLLQEGFDDKRQLEEAHKNSREHASLKFLPTDVSYVFVPKDSDIPNIINFMQSELDHYPNADLKVLFSRVISIENIKRDI
jgi:hypothetical protein